MTYLGWKLIHVLSVILFLGNITTGLFWAAHATRSRNFSLIASTFDGIIKSDRWFTLPGVFGIIISGVAAAMMTNLPLLRTGWILWPLVLFAISGIVFGLWVAPLQRKILGLATSAEGSDQDFANFKKLYRRWELWGLLAIATPLAAAIIMVLKPALPGF